MNEKLLQTLTLSNGFGLDMVFLWLNKNNNNNNSNDKYINGVFIAYWINMPLI